MLALNLFRISLNPPLHTRPSHALHTPPAGEKKHRRLQPRLGAPRGPGLRRGGAFFCFGFDAGAQVAIDAGEHNVGAFPDGLLGGAKMAGHVGDEIVLLAWSAG